MFSKEKAAVDKAKRKQAFITSNNIDYSLLSDVPDWLTNNLCDEGKYCHTLVMNYDLQKDWYKEVTKCAVEAAIDLARFNQVRVEGLDKTYASNSDKESEDNVESSFSSVSKQLSKQKFNNITISSLVKTYASRTDQNDDISTGNTFELIAKILLPASIENTIESYTKTIYSNDEVSEFSNQQNYAQKFDQQKISTLLNEFKNSGIELSKIAELKEQQMLVCQLSIDEIQATMVRGE